MTYTITCLLALPMVVLGIGLLVAYIADKAFEKFLEVVTK